MTYADLISALGRDSGDQSGEWASNALRWLNLARSYAADQGAWRTSVNPSATFLTDPAKTDGVYPLTGYSGVAGRFLFDKTNNRFIEYEAEEDINLVDPNRNDFGRPTVWSDAGTDASGNAQIRLYLIPSEVWTIVFPGMRLLTDITDTTLSADPYFGPVSMCQSMLMEGMRYYYYANDNESETQALTQLRVFDKQIAKRLNRGRTSETASFRLDNVHRLGRIVPQGKFDPAHFDNR